MTEVKCLGLGGVRACRHVSAMGGSTRLTADADPKRTSTGAPKLYTNQIPYSAANDTSDRNPLMAIKTRSSIRGTSGSGRRAPECFIRQTAAQKQKALNRMSALLSARMIHAGISPARTPLAPAPLARAKSPVLTHAL